MNEHRSITLEEASQLIDALPHREMKEAMLAHLDSFAEFVEDESSKIILYEGDVTLPHLAIKDDIVIANGNLTVTGILEDALEVNISLMLALGNVTVQNLFTFSQLCIAGDLTVQNAIIANSSHDASLLVGGDLKAALIIEDGHSFYVYGKVIADHIYADHAALLKSNLKKENFIDEVITNNEPDLDIVLKKIIAGNSIIKNTN